MHTQNSTEDHSEHKLGLAQSTSAAVHGRRNISKSGIAQDRDVMEAYPSQLTRGSGKRPVVPSGVSGTASA